MFGKKKSEPVRTFDFTPPPRPPDSDLPELPESKTWEFTHLDGSTERHAGHGLNVGEEWITVYQYSGSFWTYARYSAWYQKFRTEMVAKVSAGHVRSLKLVQ